MHLGAAAEAGITIEHVQDILVAVAPIIGTAAGLVAVITPWSAGRTSPAPALDSG
jgi:hypothetical protein